MINGYAHIIRHYCVNTNVENITLYYSEYNAIQYIKDVHNNFYYNGTILKDIKNHELMDLYENNDCELEFISKTGKYKVTIKQYPLR